MRTYTDEQIAEGAAKLRAMPKREKQKSPRSKQEAIKVMVKDILAAQKRGYSFEEIAQTLRSAEFSISAATLKSYVQRAKLGKKNEITARRDGLLG